VVTTILVVSEFDTSTPDGIIKEEIGISHLIKHHGPATWKMCSQNSRGGLYYDYQVDPDNPTDKPAFRANYPGIGWYYNSEHDIFHPPRPIDRNGHLCNSWTLNTTTGYWDPPIIKPEITQEQVEKNYWICYVWDEILYQKDNNVGWFLGERGL
jgi:hypothetical protein